MADGRIFLATTVHPVFLALPYLAGAERLVPLDTMLEDPEFPETEEVLGAVLNTAALEAVADMKGAADLNVWKYSEEKAVAWAEKRVRRVAELLQRVGADCRGGASSTIYSGSAASPEEYLRCGLGVVSEYLQPGLATATAVRLNLPPEAKPEPKSAGKGNKRQSGEQGSQPNKKVKLEGKISAKILRSCTYVSSQAHWRTILASPSSQLSRKS